MRGVFGGDVFQYWVGGVCFIVVNVIVEVDYWFCKVKKSDKWMVNKIIV